MAVIIVSFWLTFVIPSLAMSHISLFNAGHTRQKPTPKLLHRELYDMQHRWYGLGLQLDLPPSTLNVIRHNSTDAEMMLGRICEEWLCNRDGACWEDIVDALKVMRHVAMAKRIHSAYCT